MAAVPFFTHFPNSSTSSCISKHLTTIGDYVRVTNHLSTWARIAGILEQFVMTVCNSGWHAANALSDMTAGSCTNLDWNLGGSKQTLKRQSWVIQGNALAPRSLSIGR